MPINSIDDLLTALNYGSSIRQTDSTAINAKSSRSHAVLTLNLIQRKNQSSMTAPKDKRMSVPAEAMSNIDSYAGMESKLHFVDLAGSERMKNTRAFGDRAKEGIDINLGLASLGKVISQLSSRQAGAHVSYRDSKLTRILQDSLGGNAITYMIACVTPAEFHATETLNTVSYAQRARAIQSKPQIQQIYDDSDKQVVIDRLRAEVAFLRQQIRSAEGGEPRNGVPSERIDRPSEREVELQNHLLDMQESYTALGHRHAKFISELTKGSATDGEVPLSIQSVGGSAVDRLKRSQANQEQIEQVVLEYEKTIQSLEANVSTTRSSLAHTEGDLLSRESKCAFVETINHQLRSRVQKLMERESNTEIYLHELEARLDDQSSGEEKNSAVIVELRKEIARIREGEANAEDYISTLEERLAEADQDMELMQREVERLEHVVERQRSVGKLDNLLQELDRIQQHDNGPHDENHLLTNAVTTAEGEEGDGRRRSLEILKEAENMPLPGGSDDDLAIQPPEEINEERLVDEGLEDLHNAVAFSTIPIASHSPATAFTPPSPAQSKFMAEKFDGLTQELMELRLEHESTVSEYDMLNAKYHEALRTLAEMQDAVDEARHPIAQNYVSTEPGSRPVSFLEDARINEMKNGGHLSSSRSLSSELSLAGESSTSTEVSDVTPNAKQAVLHGGTLPEVETLQKMLAEREHGINLFTQRYAQLEALHEKTLDKVEELEGEVQRSKLEPPASPGHSHPVIRRMTPQNVTGTDRAHRSIASLRNIIVEEFEDRPTKMERVEVHLNAATHELQSRLERIQALEAENKKVKKDAETKSTIISGLTRERNSLKGTASSSADLTIVSQMRDQLIQNENELRSLYETYASRERELQNEIQSLKQSSNSGELSNTSEELALDGSIAPGGLAARQGEDLDLKDQELASQRERLSMLEMQLEEQKSAVEFHKHGLRSLHDTHANNIEEMKLSHAGAIAELDGRLAVSSLKHDSVVQTLMMEIENARAESNGLLKSLEAVIGQPVSASVLRTHIQTMTDEKVRAAELEVQLTSAKVELQHQMTSGHDRARLETQLDDANARILEQQGRIRRLANEVADHEESLRAKDEIIRKRDGTIATITTENQNKARIIEELEQQMESSFDQHNNRLSVIQAQGNQALVEAQARIVALEKGMENHKAVYENDPGSRRDTLKAHRPQSPLADRTNSITSNLRKSASAQSLPSPPPAIPLPPLPAMPALTLPHSVNNGPSHLAASNASTSPPPSRHTSKELAGTSNHQQQLLEDQEARLRTIEKHLNAEKQLTATLEEALVDLETQSNKVRADMDGWKKKAWQAEEEAMSLRKERRNERLSVQAVEEERDKRREAEAARAHLEERMQALSRKKKKSTLNCF